MQLYAHIHEAATLTPYASICISTHTCLHAKLTETHTSAQNSYIGPKGPTRNDRHHGRQTHTEGHMSDMTTPAGAAGQGDNWEARYTGLQKVLSKRDAELAEARSASDTRLASYESDMAELRQVRAERAAAAEEANEQAKYEALRAKFEPESPTPLSHSEFSGRTSPREPTRKELADRLDREVGKPSLANFFPDITAR
jgi:hypothetical protein